MKVRIAVLVAAAAVVLSPGATLGQGDPADGLRRVESSIASGRLTDARSTLHEWLARYPPGSPGATADHLARAAMLRGRLATDPDSARAAYVSLVLSYPFSPFTAEALLRIGQANLAAGDADAATRHLQRVISDHPASPHRATALLWLARTQGQTGDWPAACQTLRSALAGSIREIEIATILRAEADEACARTAQPGRPTPQPTTIRPNTAADSAGVRNPDSARTMDARTAGRGADRQGAVSANSLPFAIQSAALRSRANADALAARLRGQGFDARVIVVPSNTLLRVRVGRFATEVDAAAVARRMRAAGFDAVIVGDAGSERPPGDSPMPQTL